METTLGRRISWYQARESNWRRPPLQRLETARCSIPLKKKVTKQLLAGLEQGTSCLPCEQAYHSANHVIPVLGLTLYIHVRQLIALCVAGPAASWRMNKALGRKEEGRIGTARTLTSIPARIRRRLRPDSDDASGKTWTSPPTRLGRCVLSI